MTPQQTLNEAMQRMQAGEKLSYTDKEVELIMLGWKSELQKAVAAEREACKAIAVSEQKTMCEIALSHPDGSASRDRLFARARSAESIAQAIGARVAT